MGILLLLSGLTVGIAALSTSVCSAQESEIKSYPVDSTNERVRLYWQRPDGTPYGNIRSLLEDSIVRSEILMVTNGGIYGTDRRPLGLYIENGRRLSPINLAEGEGNFYIKPNGVFFLKGGRAYIENSERFMDDPDITDAVQSGPLMIRNGAIHPRFKADSTSRKIRNAVGITRKGGIVFLFSPKPVTFYDFARHARKRYAIVDLLYLDGTISQMYTAPSDLPVPGRQAFVTMIAIERINR